MGKDFRDKSRCLQQSNGQILLAMGKYDEIKTGNELTKGIISRTSNQADDEGVTGFMANWALGALKKFWYYGDMLDGVKSIYDF